MTPLIIEIVDSEESITRFLSVLDGLLDRAGQGGLVTLEKVEVMRYAPRSS